MKFSSILVTTSLAALTSAVLPQYVTEAIDRVADTLDYFYLTQDNALQVYLAPFVHASIDNPDYREKIYEIENFRPIDEGFDSVISLVKKAIEAAAVLATEQESVQAATDAASAYDAVVNAGNDLAISLSNKYNDILDLSETLKGIDEYLHDSKGIAKYISDAKHDLPELGKDVLNGIQSARDASDACRTFANAAAHADVDTVAS